MRLVLAAPPAVVALLEYEDARALRQRQLVGLLRLVVVLDDRRAQRLGGLGAPPARGLPARPRPRPAARTCRANWRAVGRQRLRPGPLLHFLFDAGTL